MTSQNAERPGGASANARSAPSATIASIRRDDSRVRSPPPRESMKTTSTPNAALKMSTTGTFTEYSLGGTHQPWDITSGPDGALWFTEAGSGEIGRITTAGVVTNEFALPTPTHTTS